VLLLVSAKRTVGHACERAAKEDPYLFKVRRAGGFRQYEAQVTKSLAAIFEPKFPKLPAEVIRTIVAFWAHVGDY
jgi:hypothetical protein